MTEMKGFISEFISIFTIVLIGILAVPAAFFLTLIKGIWSIGGKAVK